MAGLSAVSSKLKYLSTVSTSKKIGQQVSVVHYDPAAHDSVTFPENMNERGCLLVPHVLSEQQWSEKHS